MGLLDLARGALRGTTADYLGSPVDAYNTAIGLLAPEASGNIYANTIRQALPEPIQTGTSDWWAQQMGLPQGQGMMYEAGRMMAPSPRGLLTAARNVPIQELITYHGTPHRFPATEANPLGEFEASKIGTGEGAQAYGHGIYFAENPSVAKGYASELGGDAVKEIPTLIKRLQNEVSAGASLSSDDVLFAIKGLPGLEPLQNSSEFKKLALRAVQGDSDAMTGMQNLASQFGKKGSLYTADLPDEMVDRMLDWDKPLKEQSPYVQKIIADEIKRIGASADTGEQAYKQLMFEARMQGNKSGSSVMRNNLEASEASKRLSELGIPGIKYLDQGSRDAGKGTRNFVVFPGEEKKVKILKRD